MLRTYFHPTIVQRNSSFYRILFSLSAFWYGWRRSKKKKKKRGRGNINLENFFDRFYMRPIRHRREIEEKKYGQSGVRGVRFEREAGTKRKNSMKAINTVELVQSKEAETLSPLEIIVHRRKDRLDQSLKHSPSQTFYSQSF